MEFILGNAKEGSMETFPRKVWLSCMNIVLQTVNEIK